MFSVDYEFLVIKYNSLYDMIKENKDIIKEMKLIELCELLKKYELLINKCFEFEKYINFEINKINSKI